MATADWKVASSDRETGRQLMERSAIRNSWRGDTTVTFPHFLTQRSLQAATNESWAHLGGALAAA